MEVSITACNTLSASLLKRSVGRDLRLNTRQRTAVPQGQKRRGVEERRRSSSPVQVMQIGRWLAEMRCRLGLSATFPTFDNEVGTLFVVIQPEELPAKAGTALARFAARIQTSELSDPARARVVAEEQAVITRPLFS